MQASSENNVARVGTTSPAKHQHPKKLQKTRSWDRVIVYNADSGDVRIRRKGDVDRERNDYKELKLPKGKNQVSLFVDQETETNFKTEEESRGSDDVFLATLSLDNLGVVNRAFFVFGFLSTLYVYTPWQNSNLKYLS
ncbi:hypothetical protein HBI24_223120 [Parastagonospora nodorum]|nr:hypothetical protein HBI10_221610 [Parastagonospora nodorum]KAH4009677.1 hypothetical protein HBI13_217860 [Parastagonospora nodorum]KAH4043558.1 hypothetical protein HBH49_231970 [Parastagonospora nodorum]KAH4089140.1 hypothetical protein HBH46_193200 [Parastagonospora nodorum]KAH5003596.1 hypothetical protein HBI74_233180 [Parastagonospora nodorum]